jgi:subtilisin-like proprotein convertase family protein
MTKKTIVQWIAGLSLLASSCPAGLVTFNVNTAIPDFDETGLQDTQTISGYTNLIESVKVHLTLSGNPLAFDGDFFVSLQCENGGYSVLLNRIGRTAINPFGYNANGFDVVFSLGGNDIHLAENFSPSYDGSGRLTGTWGADARNIDPDNVLDTDLRTADLNAFAGINPNGNWTLFVSDMNLNGSATLVSWGLDIAAVPEPATFILFGIGGMGAWLLRRNKLKSSSDGLMPGDGKADRLG